MAARFDPARFVRSPWARPLIPVSWIYGRVALARRNRFEANAVALPVPVVSVGNVTTGGTGKTPTVELLVRELLARGRRPAILSRGYRAARGELSDEAQLLALNLPDVPHHVGADRVLTGRAAVDRGADVLVLDDGFQHARLKRDLDIVLFDALDPFGGGRVLPAGLLREPLEVLSRAGLVCITRGQLVPREDVEILRGILRDRCPDAPHVELATDAQGWEPLPCPPGVQSCAPESFSGKRALVFAGIGNPSAFFLTLRAMGLEIAETVRFPDHHPYTSADLASIGARARALGVAVVATTQKDAVKLGGHLDPAGPPWFYLRIACRVGAGEALWRRALDQLLCRHKSSPSPGSRCEGEGA